MKKLYTASALTFACLTLGTGSRALGQTTYNYDFGTGNGTYNTPSGTSTTFLPAPASGGGTAFVRVGTGAGSLTLANPGNPNLGTDTELVLTAPSTASVTKFSLYGYTGAPTSHVGFSAVLGGNVGTFFVATGNGAQFSDGNAFSSAQTFTGLQFVLGGTTAAPTVTTTYRSGTGSSATGLTTTGILAATVLGFDIYGNNSASSVAYTAFGLGNTVAPNSFDIFLNGSLIGNDLSKATLPDATNINSFLVYGLSSTGNVGTFSVDDISYGAISVPEPSTYAMMAGAFGLLLVGQRIRRTARA